MRPVSYGSLLSRRVKRIQYIRVELCYRQREDDSAEKHSSPDVYIRRVHVSDRLNSTI